MLQPEEAWLALLLQALFPTGWLSLLSHGSYSLLLHLPAQTLRMSPMEAGSTASPPSSRLWELSHPVLPSAWGSPQRWDNKGQKLWHLTEAEDIKNRWQEYPEELYKKDLHDPYNHNGVITHLEQDILECQVKWAWGSIATNKASGGDGIPVELFQILKDDAVKVSTQYASKFRKLSNGHRTGKGQFSF